MELIQLTDKELEDLQDQIEATRLPLMTRNQTITMYNVTLLQDTLVGCYQTGDWQSITLYNESAAGRVFAASSIHYRPNGGIELIHPRGPETVYVLPADARIEVQRVQTVTEVKQSPTMTLTVHSGVRVPYTYGEGYKAYLYPASQYQITAYHPTYRGYHVTLKAPDRTSITIFIKDEDMVNIRISESKETNFKLHSQGVNQCHKSN